MSQNSSIEWTDTTWNPVAGCSIVSAGCANCYAMRMAARLEAMGQKKYAGLTEKKKGKAVWTGKINLDRDAVDEPFSWKKPRLVFVNSMSDLFHPHVPYDFVDEVFAAMAMTPRHTYQVLTKRPDLMAEYLLTRWQAPNPPFDGPTDREDQVHRTCEDIITRLALADTTNSELWDENDSLKITQFGWPLPNVWLGTSVENQKAADERIPQLLRCPAAVRFLSCEPLLGPVDLSRWIHDGVRPGVDVDIDGGVWPGGREPFADRPPIHWVIWGGESGPGSRNFNLEWARDIVRVCASGRVAVYGKQLGAKPVNKNGQRYENSKHSKGACMSEWPDDLRVRQFPNREVTRAA